jgi:hypothetical protein
MDTGKPLQLERAVAPGEMVGGKQGPPMHLMDGSCVPRGNGAEGLAVQGGDEGPSAELQVIQRSKLPGCLRVVCCCLLASLPASASLCRAPHPATTLAHRLPLENPLRRSAHHTLSPNMALWPWMCAVGLGATAGDLSMLLAASWLPQFCHPLDTCA